MLMSLLLVGDGGCLRPAADRDCGRGGGDGGGDVGFGGGLVDAEAGENARAIFEFEQREQNVLRSDVAVAEPQGLPERQLQPFFARASNGTRAGTSPAGGGSAAAAVWRTVSSATPCANDRPGGECIRIAQQPQHQVLGRISSLPAAWASFCAAITTFLPAPVNR
jgi:hypothetical protein